MKRKILMRALLGIPVGITIGHGITILISLGWGTGEFVPCVPELVATVGNEVYAVLVQTLLCGAMGGGFAAASWIWSVERWSMLKRTFLHFVASALLMLPVAYFLYWMEHSLKGICIYFGIFALIFATVWLIQYVSWKWYVQKLNKKLGQTKPED